MQTSLWLKSAENLLKDSDVESSRIDSLILLEDETGKDRGWLLAHPEHDLSSDQVDRLQKLLERRTHHEPMAYIRGHSEFYGRTFVINKDVLVPRPESESMIELLLKIYPDLVQHKTNFGSLVATTVESPDTIKIGDVGCGSGALGITAKLELPKTPKVAVELLDIDTEALKVAKTNVDKLTSDVNIIQSDLLTNSSATNDVLLCNLPYVPDAYPINEAARHEPEIALFSGTDGLDHYRKLFDQLHKHKNKPLYLLIESLRIQHTRLTLIGQKYGYRLTDTKGLVQLYKYYK